MEHELNLVSSLMAMLEYKDAKIFRKQSGLLFLEFDLDDSTAAIPLDSEFFGFIQPGESRLIEDLYYILED